MIVLGIDPGPQTHGAVVYDTDARRVLWSSKAATTAEVEVWLYAYEGAAPLQFSEALTVLIERPAAMGSIGVGIVGHMLDTAWVGGGLSYAAIVAGCGTHTMTRREVLRHLGVLSGKGSADSRVRAACIADHETPGGPPAGGRKA